MTAASMTAASMTAASMTRLHTPAFSDRQEYRITFAATFGIFLVAAVLMRVVRSISGRRPATGATSLFAEARSTGYSALAFAFMG